MQLKQTLKQSRQQLFQKYLQIHQNAQKYRHRHGLWRARPLEKKTARKLNSTTKQTELEGKVSYNSFHPSIKLIDNFQNLKNRESEFANQENYISVSGKIRLRQMAQF